MTSRSSTEQDLAKDALRQKGLRATPTRVDVLIALNGSRAPLTAQEVTQRLRGGDADRVTVYRTLSTLVEAGLAHRMDPGDRVFRFALVHPLGTPAPAHAEKSDTPASGHGHPHLVCDSCGTVECVDDAEVVVHRRDSATPARGAFKVKQQQVILHGTCEDCASDAPAKPSRAWRGPRKS